MEAEPTVEMDDHAPVVDTAPPEQPMEPLPAPPWAVADPPAVAEAPASDGVREEKYETGDYYRGTFNGELREGKGLYVYAEGPIKEFEGDFKAGWGHGLGRFKCVPTSAVAHSLYPVCCGCCHPSRSSCRSPTSLRRKGAGRKTATVRYFLAAPPFVARPALCHGALIRSRLGSGGRFSDGGHYEGEVAQGNMHGCGKLVMANGATYTGMFNAGLMGGRGVHVNTDGSCTYKGEWAEGKKSGRGMQSSANGDNYDGDWRDNLMHGQVCSRLPTGALPTHSCCLHGSVEDRASTQQTERERHLARTGAGDAAVGQRRRVRGRVRQGQALRLRRDDVQGGAGRRAAAAVRGRLAQGHLSRPRAAHLDRRHQGGRHVEGRTPAGHRRRTPVVGRPVLLVQALLVPCAQHLKGTPNLATCKFRGGQVAERELMGTLVGAGAARR